MLLQRQQLCRGAAAAALAPSLPAVSHHHHVARHSNTSCGSSRAAAAWTPAAARTSGQARYSSNDTSNSTSPPAAAVWMAPSSSMADTEACVKLLGQAYMNHRWCRELQVQPGKEAQLFSGLARCVLDLFADEPVLLSSQHAGAAVVLTGEQEAQLVAALQGLDFAILPGTLQILQAIPEARLPKLTALLQDLQQHTAAQAAHQAATSGCRKLLCMGVAPGSQGRGTGGELLAAAAAAATEARVPLYADAADEVAVGMLQRRGFKVVGSSTANCTQLVLTPL